MTQYADILILALIALFVILRLRNTLGKDIGHKPDFTDLRKHLTGEKPAEKEKDAAQKAAAGVNPKSPLLTPREEENALLASLGDPKLIAGVDAMREADPSFSVNQFLDGAKGAFEWVINAYNEGDTETLKNLMAPELFAEYQAAMNAANALEEKPETTLVKIVDAQLISAAVENNRARMVVRFLSEQVEVTRNKEGAIIAGDASKTETIDDEWVFERDVKSKNPNWQVMDT